MDEALTFFLRRARKQELPDDVKSLVAHRLRNLIIAPDALSQKHLARQAHKKPALRKAIRSHASIKNGSTLMLPQWSKLNVHWNRPRVASETCAGAKNF